MKTIIITLICFFSCAYCDEGTSGQRVSDLLSQGKFDEAVKFMISELPDVTIVSHERLITDQYLQEVQLLSDRCADVFTLNYPDFIEFSKAAMKIKQDIDEPTLSVLRMQGIVINRVIELRLAHSSEESKLELSQELLDDLEMAKPYFKVFNALYINGYKDRLVINLPPGVTKYEGSTINISREEIELNRKMNSQQFFLKELDIAYTWRFKEALAKLGELMPGNKARIKEIIKENGFSEKDFREFISQ